MNLAEICYWKGEIFKGIGVLFYVRVKYVVAFAIAGDEGNMKEILEPLFLGC